MVTDGYWTVRDYFVRYRNVKALCYTPETNVTSHVNHSLKTALHWGEGDSKRIKAAMFNKATHVTSHTHSEQIPDTLSVVRGLGALLSTRKKSRH